jgi:nicotinamidase-related amidase
VAFDIARTALLAMDCQTGIVSIYAKPQDEFLARASMVLRAARDAAMAVIHVRVGFRSGLPEVSTRNKLFARIKSSPQHQQLFDGELGAVHPSLIDHQNDIVVTKSRVDAFAGTDLEIILRARDITTLVLFGIATSGVVLSTLLHACDADYQLFVISDCCADLDVELHGVLLTRLFPQRATVMTASEFVQAVRSDAQIDLAAARMRSASLLRVPNALRRLK